MSPQSVEIAPGITRIESVLGPRPFSQYLVREERSLLVDTGVRETPGEVILPALAGLMPDFVLISHADVDHFGGNEAIRAAAPEAIFCAHEADVPWIENSELILRERYGWYDDYGIGYPQETLAWLRGAMGRDVAIDLRLRGGETFRLGPRLAVEIVPLPGHSPGHVGVWEPSSRTAIVMDAVMANGLLDTDGNVVHPPPIVDIAGYEQSVRLLQSLEPQRLLTAHYDVIEGADVDRFLADSLAFVDRARRTVATGGDVPLRDLLERANAELGPFTSMPNELAATLRAIVHEQGKELVG